MSTIAKLTGTDFDRMVQRGAFLDLEPLKIELIHGELLFKNPAGPVPEGKLGYLTNWSCLCHSAAELPLRELFDLDS